MDGDRAYPAIGVQERGFPLRPGGSRGGALLGAEPPELARVGEQQLPAVVSERRIQAAGVVGGVAGSRRLSGLFLEHLDDDDSCGAALWFPLRSVVIHLT